MKMAKRMTSVHLTKCSLVWHGPFKNDEIHVSFTNKVRSVAMPIYTTKGGPSSKCKEFLAGRSKFDSDHDQIWQACADRSGNGSYLNKLAP